MDIYIDTIMFLFSFALNIHTKYILIDKNN